MNEFPFKGFRWPVLPPIFIDHFLEAERPEGCIENLSPSASCSLKMEEGFCGLDLATELFHNSIGLFCHNSELGTSTMR